MYKEIIKKFEYQGFNCTIRRFEIEDEDDRSLCIEDITDKNHWFAGYVEIPEDHELFNCWEYQANDVVMVYGGITFASHHYGPFAIGFDCGHAGDDPTIQNADFVESELKRLVEQL